MTTPIDRGIVVMKTEGDGTQTVLVCSGVSNGQPVDVFAMHVGRVSVQVEPGVRLVRAGKIAHTADMATAQADASGVVHVRAPRQDPGPLLDRRVVSGAPTLG